MTEHFSLLLSLPPFRVVNKLPNENQLFLSYLMPLLHHISKNHEINGMNSINLAICFAPSLLWPSSGLDVIKNEVPPLIQFMIEHCPEIFGSELPVLYKQAVLPPSPGVENMEFSISAPTTKHFVPTKVDDGEYSHHSSHKRSDSIGSSMSEGSTAEAEDHTASLLRARKSGLTLSDSQLSQISQLEEYEPVKPSAVHIRKRGKIEVSGKHIHTENGGLGGNIMLSSPGDQPSPKRVKKTRVPERSSSLHGPNDMSHSRTKYVRSRPTNEPIAARRRSVAIQEPLQLRKHDFVPNFDVIPPSPDSSYGSSSHNYSPKMTKRIHQGHQYYSGYGRRDDSHAVGQKKSRKLPQYSHSFTSKDMEKPSRPIPSSSSFYDKLLPLDSAEGSGRPRNEHRITGTFTTQLELLSSSDDTHHQRPILTSTTMQASFPSGSGSSTHSVSSSSISSQTRPSNLSLTTGESGGSLNRASPELLLHNNKGEFIKVAISDRFKLNSSGGMDYPHVSVVTPASYPQSDGASSREGFTSPGESESGQDSLERIQRKFHERNERKRLDSNSSESAFSKSSSYRGFLSTQHTKDSLISLAEESGFDDRPECDFHMGSLTRQRAGDSDPNKLYTGNGYNSDTESAPSRTLSRPGKIKEVMSPTKTTMPSRYYMKPPPTQQQPQPEATGKVTLSSSHQQPPYKHQHQQKGLQQSQQQQQLSSGGQQQQQQQQSASYGGVESTPTTIPVIAEPLLVTTTRTITNGSRRRPKSGNGAGDSRVEKLTEVYKAREQEQVNANIEDAKIRLGLIPPAPTTTITPVQRQRSKSTSENEAMKILHRVPDHETEGALASNEPPHEEESTSKHKEWLSSAPTPAERKEARENYSKSQLYKSRSLRNGSDKAVVLVGAPTKVSITPETKRKYSTLPDIATVKTVKVHSYKIPEPQKIRRINLRTYH